MKTRKALIAGLALTLTVGTVSLSVAHGTRGGHIMGSGMMHGQQMTSQTPEQQKEVQAIEAKYSKDLTAKETAIRSKGAELDKALADGSTTLATLKDLRNELAGLEQEYWQLREQVNNEISKKIGTTYYGATGWGSDNCPWHDNHNTTGHMMGRGMMDGQGTMGHGRMSGMHCRW